MKRENERLAIHFDDKILTGDIRIDKRVVYTTPKMTVNSVRYFKNILHNQSFTKVGRTGELRIKPL